MHGIGFWVLLACVAQDSVALAGKSVRATDGPTSSLPRELRRQGRRLDRSLNQIDRAILDLDERQYRKKSRGHIRSAQKKLGRFLDDPEVACAVSALDQALLVLDDPLFEPRENIAPFTIHTDAAVSCIANSETFTESHTDGVFYLGRSASFKRHNTRVFFLNTIKGPFEELVVAGSRADLYIDSLKIFFDGGEAVVSQVHRGLRDLGSGRKVVITLRGQFIDFIRITAHSEEFDRSGSLKFWGRAAE